MTRPRNRIRCVPLDSDILGSLMLPGVPRTWSRRPC